MMPGRVREVLSKGHHRIERHRRRPDGDRCDGPECGLPLAPGDDRIIERHPVPAKLNLEIEDGRTSLQGGQEGLLQVVLLPPRFEPDRLSEFTDEPHAQPQDRNDHVVDEHPDPEPHPLKRQPPPLGPRPELHLRLAVRVRRLTEVGPHERVRAEVHRQHQRDEPSEPKPEWAPSEEKPDCPANEGRRLADPGDGCGEIDEVCRRSRKKCVVGDEQKVLRAFAGASGHPHDLDRHSPRVTVEIVSHLERIRESDPRLILARPREQSLGEEPFEVADFEGGGHTSVVFRMGVAPRGLVRRRPRVLLAQVIHEGRDDCIDCGPVLESCPAQRRRAAACRGRQEVVPPMS